MTGTTSEATHLEKKRQVLLGRRVRLIEQFDKAARACRQAQLGKLYERIRRTNEFLEALDEIEEESKAAKPGSASPRYAISSLFLHECFKDLTADADEQFFFITGSVVDGVHVLDQKIEFQHQKRTMVGVVGSHPATHKLLIKLEQFGHRLLGSFHSHPGKGPGATHPSGTDEGFQRRLESGGHVAVAAIFSRDGYVRFFRMDKSPEIEIYGDGVEKCDGNVYRLAQIDKG